MLTPTLRAPKDNHEILARLIEILAPGERDLVAFLQAYFDESGTHDGSPVLCVAGYLFEKDRCINLHKEWKSVLDRFSLPFFHMVDCAHGNEHFANLTKSEQDCVAREMIGLIRAHALFGTGVAIIESEYKEIFPPSTQVTLPSDSLTATLPGSPYSFCCSIVLAAIQCWIIRKGFEGDIAYFFEAGHKHGNEFNAIMNRIVQVPTLQRAYRYSAHAFVQKEKAGGPIQAADIIAWHHATDVKKILLGKPRRRDYLALMEGQDVDMKFIMRNHLLTMRSQVDMLLAGKPLITGTFGSIPFVST